MKSFPIILAAVAFALGAGLVAAIKSNSGNDDSAAKLAAAEKRIADLEARTKSPSAVPKAVPTANIESVEAPAPAKSGLTAILEQMGKTEVNGENVTPEEQIAKLTNTPEARAFMKGMAGIMTQRADQMIGREVAKYKSKLDLTDAQAESIQGKMVAMVKENTKKFQADMDDESRTTQEIMESQGDFWQQNESAIDDLLKEELNDDQFVQYEREQLVERTQRIQRRADSKLEAIDTTLELNETQEDQVFSILVQQSPEYDEAMALEGVGSDLPPAAVAEGVSEEDAIRSVLDPGQLETYNTTLESGGFNQRRGPWGRR